MKNQLIVMLMITFALLTACTEDDNHAVSQQCDARAMVVTNAAFNAVNTSNYTVTNVTLSGDCLAITIASSGCSASQWQMNVVASENFSFISPPQRDLKVGLVNNELCLAVFEKSVTYDLSPLQVPGSNQLLLTVSGWNGTLTYTY